MTPLSGRDWELRNSETKTWYRNHIAYVVVDLTFVYVFFELKNKGYCASTYYGEVSDGRNVE